MRIVNLAALVVLVFSACGDDTGAGGGDGGSGGDGGKGKDACVGLQCQQTTCPNFGTTSVSGLVTIPAGTLPLPNVIVYVPNGPLADLPTGPTCDRCDSLLSGLPITRTTTKTNGRFSLPNVPAGVPFPIVIQIGKWRTSTMVPAVTKCTNFDITDTSKTRLPGRQADGHIPRIALTTGGADALECLLRKVGIADSEFSNEGGPGRVTLFNGTDGTDKYTSTLNAGASFGDAPTFWDKYDNLAKYDMVLLSCEGTDAPTNKSPSAVLAMQKFTTMGGRVFASHWHNYWVEHGPPPWPTIATFNHQADLADPFLATIDTSFAKGATMSEWLMMNGGAATPGQLSIHAAQHTIDAVNPALAQRWIYSTTPQSIQYLTFNTPVDRPPAEQCGRMVVSDIHVSSGDKSGTTLPFPDGCTTTDLTQQEKALIFMLFDLGSCITPDIG